MATATDSGVRPADGSAPASFELVASRQFVSWLAEQRVSLAYTTYLTGMLFLLGRTHEGRLSVFNRTFSRAMGLCAHGSALYLSTLYQLWRFEDAVGAGQRYEGYDRAYVPRVAYTTGDLDVHDVGVDRLGRPVFVNTLFSCLATVSDRYSFAPLWRPPFISKLAAEDRCHLNGLAMAEGEPRYVTALSRSDVADGWRDHRRSGGVLLDVRDASVVLEGLSMPHSPRLHGERLWLLESGTGFLGYADLARGRFERVAFCPGYARGLTFVGDFAVVAVSATRQERTFSGLVLDDNLAARRAEPRCGLLVIDLRSGDAVHSLRFGGVVQELYDVALLPDVQRPMALGLKTDEIRRVISVAPAVAGAPAVPSE